MKFDKLRLTGFKSFVEPTDFEIRPGLTGIVGPNGCGKSNLLESLRWVMGATSAKALRGGGMEDVIFAGTGNRPARNWAEVTLWLDNDTRDLPAEFNENDQLEVSRRILKKEEGSQSIYKINGKDVRAKDVQLLFADASTGANSPALVRQGQISELINAKPQNRRKLLEEAAGITGLHTRRHEAELRLRAAETNLERLDDVTGEMESQRAALAKQARQATRYRNVSGDIRRTEALLAHLRYTEAHDAFEASKIEMAEISQLLEETARAVTTATTQQARCHEALDPLRNKEAEAAAALHRLNVAMEGLEEELERARTENERLLSTKEQLERDLIREKDLGADAEQALTQIAAEEEQLQQRQANEADRLTKAESDLADETEALTLAESAFERENTEAATQEAEHRSLNRALQEAENRLATLTHNLEKLAEEKQNLALSTEEKQALETALQEVSATQVRIEECEQKAQNGADIRLTARAEEEELRTPRDAARQTVTELQAEADAIRKILASHAEGDFPAILEKITAQSGYENALAAALGDTLSAPLAEEAASHWSGLGQEVIESAPLPLEAKPLSDFIDAPVALKRRLASIGVVYASDGTRLQNQLHPGQRLVTLEGDLWRWDGYVQKAEAKTAAAIRLEQKNRLDILYRDITEAESTLANISDQYDAARQKLAQAESDYEQAQQALRLARQTSVDALNKQNQLQKQHEQTNTRLATIAETITRLSQDREELEQTISTHQNAMAGLPDIAQLRQSVEAARQRLAEQRQKTTEARATHNDLAREASMRLARLDEIARERGVWTSRAETAAIRIGEVSERLEAIRVNITETENAPQAIEEKRKTLFENLEEAESRRRHAADELAEAQQQASDADRLLKEVEAEAISAREARARIEAHLDAAKERIEQAIELAHESCDAMPDQLLEIAEHKEGKDLPSREDIDRKLERYKRERENLGGVNLRADEEMTEIDARLDEINTEREDCEAAIRKLRAAIGSLNKEGRVRLLEAFETVNENFQKLFTRLFGGGQAELRLIDSDDPLEAGLEIFASPPGKKLTSMSLMSGGEQALTATSLIFAVFMANPAPVCVLDEVDAPLDDANVDRFCQMLDEMAQETETKFIVITHHALTMSRMDRLYGVTMIERGVSQLVSVDLINAEQLVAAE